MLRGLKKSFRLKVKNVVNGNVKLPSLKKMNSSFSSSGYNILEDGESLCTSEIL